ncbi:MAG: PTS fructose transporter subunit IIA [Neisseriaceae bacterium]|nr:PTS fructose transporter subunit IIA [Neisseriaceae bacterium]
MKTGILLVSHTTKHGSMGDNLADNVAHCYGDSPAHLKTLAVGHDEDLDSLRERISKQVLALNQGYGVIILVDILGATPCNIASEFVSDKVAVVAGMNLPMVLRVLSYAQLGLLCVIDKALSGGRDGVVISERSGSAFC